MNELINEARHFGLEELFFSTTDLAGRIQRANRVFERISDFSWDELRNKPHNIIRHPDMPRVAFQLVWDRIQSGRAAVAFVKNLAHDGRYYWVVALMVPIPGGYLSVRFKPSSPLLSTVEQLYGELRTVEAAIETDSKNRKAAIAASTAALNAALRALGFSGYDDFMQHALKVEMQSMEAARSASLVPVFQEHARDRSPRGESLKVASALLDQLVTLLNTLFQGLEEYVKINASVRSESFSLAEVSESLRVSALNGSIAVEKLGSQSAGLRPVLESLRALSGEITQEGARLSASLAELISEVDLVVFDLCAAKLETEMSAQFVHELINQASMETGDASHELMTDGAISTLYAVSRDTAGRALKRLAVIKGRLTVLTLSQGRLREASHSLRPIYLAGMVELAAGAGSRLVTVFADLGAQLEETSANLSRLKDILEVLDEHLIRGLENGSRVEETIRQLDSPVKALVRFGL